MHLCDDRLSDSPTSLFKGIRRAAESSPSAQVELVRPSQSRQRTSGSDVACLMAAVVVLCSCGQTRVILVGWRQKQAMLEGSSVGRQARYGAVRGPKCVTSDHLSRAWRPTAGRPGRAVYDCGSTYTTLLPCAVAAGNLRRSAKHINGLPEGSPAARRAFSQ